MTDSCSYSPILAWVNTHRDRLPQTLAELAQYPMAYRRMIHGALPVQVRLCLWHEHLSSFLGPAAPLSLEQQAFVREYRDALPSVLTDPPNYDLLRAFSDRGCAVLGVEQGARVLATLGPPEPDEGLPVPPD